MKLGNITNLDIIALNEASTELFRLRKYKSKEYVELYIGLGLHRSGYYGTYNPSNKETKALSKTEIVFNSSLDINLLIEGVMVLDKIPTNIGSGDVIFWGLGTLIVDDVFVYDGHALNIKWGDIKGTITDQIDLVNYINSQITSVTDPLDTRLTYLENNIYEVTYTETIDISAGTGGTISFPAGATLEETEFPGNAVLSTKTGAQINYETPFNGPTPVTVNLDAGGNYTPSASYPDPVALIFRLRVKATDFQNLDNDKVIEFWINTAPNFNGNHSSLNLDDGTNPHGTTKTDVGLGNVDDVKQYPDSNPSGFETPTQLDVRDTANRDRANHTGTQTLSTISDAGALASGDNASDVPVTPAGGITSTNVQDALEELDSEIGSILPPFSGNHSDLSLDDGTNPHGTTKTDVGLGNVDNTSDLDKPISTATQTALDGKVSSVVAGEDISVDNTDTQNPVVASTRLPKLIAFAEDSTQTITFSNTGVVYLNLAANGLDDAATYKVSGFYIWSHDAINTDFFMEVRNFAALLPPARHQQEPKDIGADQRYYTAFEWTVTPIAGSIAIDLNFGTNDITDSSTLYGAYLQLDKIT